MGLFNGGLLGAILRSASQSREDEIRRAAAREWYDSFTKPPSGGRGYECKFCGMKFRHCKSRPSVTQGGGCRQSPYGSHSWIEL